MALFDLRNLRAGGGTHLHGDDVVKMARAIGELQNLKVNVVTGNQLANVSLTLTGITAVDTVIAVLEQDSTSGVLAAHAGTVTIHAADTLRSTAATTGKNLIVVWADRPA